MMQGKYNVILILALLLLFLFSGIVFFYDFEKYEKSSLTGKLTTDGTTRICINSPPQVIDHNCTFDLEARKDGILRHRYKCMLNSTDNDGDSITHYIDSEYAEIDEEQGNITIYGNIKQDLGERPEKIKITPVLFDNSSCDNNKTSKNIFLNVSYSSQVVRIQNYTSNTSDYIELKEGYTTYHKSLDEYFKDIDDFPLNYTYTFLDLHCFNIHIDIDPDSKVVSYYPNYDAGTSDTGPCNAYFTATNPYGVKNYSNEFEIYVEETERPEDDTTDGTGGGSPRDSGGGGTSAPRETECRLWNVNCSDWGDCELNPDYDIDSGMGLDGLQERECTWSTNCPGEVEPDMERACDYEATCDDGIQNCHRMDDGSILCEEGVDCGGPCPPCVVEEGDVCSDDDDCDDWLYCIDGVCAEATCDDGMQNCHVMENGSILCEEGIDCGGPCPPCPTCDDGIRNCHIMEDGSILCEEGVDCGGPCPPCVDEDTPNGEEGNRMLQILFYLLIILLLAYPARVFYVKTKELYQKKKMESAKKRIQKNREIFSYSYLKHFDEQLKQLVSDFDAVTHEEAKREADTMVFSEGFTGYNVDRYSVSFDNDYADVLNDDSITTINYAMYFEDIEHGRKILNELSKSGVMVNYNVCKRSSAVLWDDKWGHERKAKYESVNGKKVARTVEYIISFKPRNKHEAKKIIKYLEIYGKGTQREGVKGSWDVPDIRVTGNEQLLDYEKRILNTKSVAGQKILILTKDNPVPGCEYKDIWVNPELAKFVK